MKKILPLVVLIAFLSSACNHSNKEILFIGNVDNGERKWVFIELIKPDDTILIDSAKVIKGSFVLKVNPSDYFDNELFTQPAFYRLYFTHNNFITTLAHCGDKIILSADAHNLVNSYSVSGSLDATLMWQLDTALAHFITHTDSLQVFYDLNIESDSARMIVENQYMKLVQQHTSFLRNFINSNPKSLATLPAFYQFYNKRQFFNENNDLQLLTQIYNNLAATYPNNENVVFLKQRMNRIRQ